MVGCEEIVTATVPAVCGALTLNVNTSDVLYGNPFGTASGTSQKYKRSKDKQ